MGEGAQYSHGSLWLVTARCSRLDAAGSTQQGQHTRTARGARLGAYGSTRTRALLLEVVRLHHTRGSTAPFLNTPRRTWLSHTPHARRSEGGSHVHAKCGNRVGPHSVLARCVHTKSPRGVLFICLGARCDAAHRRVCRKVRRMITPSGSHRSPPVPPCDVPCPI